jgi:lipoyl-dependent peroxiredoxin
MERKASAVWKGGLKDGQGSLTTPSGVLSETRYSFIDRFESGTGTNPEELVAAAHAGCFSMALSAELGNAGMKPESIRTTATLTFEKKEKGFTVTRIHLDTTARVPGADAGCPISRLLNTEITLSARLEAMAGQR